MTLAEAHKSKILNEKRSTDSFVVIGRTLNDMYYKDKCLSSQKEFLNWTKSQLGFSKSTTYEYMISYKIFSELESALSEIGSPILPPVYQSHCQLLAKIPKEALLNAWIGVNQAAGNALITTAFLEAYLDEQGLLPKTGKEKTKRSLAAPKKRNPPAPKKTKAGTKRRKRKAKSDTEDEISSLTESSQSDTDNIYYLKQESAEEEKENVDMQTPPQHVPKTPITPTSAIPTPSQSRPISVAPSPAHSFQSFSWMSPTRSVQSPVALSRQGTPASSPLTFSPLPKASSSMIPFDPHFVKQVGRGVVLGQQFDVSIDSVEDLNRLEIGYGRIWCCVPDARPVSTLRQPEPLQTGLERILQIVFTKFANKEFAEGLFLIRGELGADWCTPVLQHPFCILRHLALPMEMMESKERAFESYIVFYLGPNIRDFCSVFRGLGLVPGVNCWSAMLPVHVPNMNMYYPNQYASLTKSHHGDQDSLSDERLEEVASVLCDMGRSGS